MRKKTINKRKGFLSVLVVMAMLMATILTACGSSKAAVPSTEAETTKVETVKEEVAEPATPPETEEVVEEVAEPEPTATPEDSKYPGIDMESTLPGIEWLDTLDGIITEPKLVVFNDETNKKVIVEKGDTIEFSKTDTLAVYIPEGKEATLVSYSLEVFGKAENIGRYILATELDEFWNSGKRKDTIISIDYDNQNMDLSVKLKFMD